MKHRYYYANRDNVEHLHLYLHILNARSADYHIGSFLKKHESVVFILRDETNGSNECYTFCGIVFAGTCSEVSDWIERKAESVRQEVIKRGRNSA